MKGKIVFFKKVIEKFEKLELTSTAPKGSMFFGIILGQVRPKAPDPTPKDCVGIMGTIGWCKFDDIGEALSKAQMLKVVKHIEKKYGDKDANSASDQEKTV